MSDIVAAKQALRSSMRAELRALQSAVLAEWSEALLQQLMGIARDWPAGQVVSVFGGLRAEPDLLVDFVPELTRLGHRAVLFAVDGEDLVAYEVSGVEDAVRGMMGVWEPVRLPLRQVGLQEINIALTPGLAFGLEDGSRLGRGRGFYDRFFAKASAELLRIGVGWDLQVCAQVPKESHDALMHIVVTQTGIRRVGL
ncbi:MAG: 5-formyltetrahydrofolate cyclo-ligase [Verrucomicrobiales bacterium]|nr:5-formyltetrahydrofolate cyclo-ligase [Verrucomicrobiales bacterium]MCP5558430.1 5-formyltetrahydrofolate cyclo-ligase [Verrucomicrobiaceae bacterium]